MSPVIRLSDSTYNRLELHAVGFDAPNNVIERLIDFYESHHKNSQKSNSELHETTQVTRPDTTPLSVNTKRPLGRKDGEKFRDYVIPVIKLMKSDMSHTDAFCRIAEKLDVRKNTVSSECTRGLGINTEKFIKLVKSNKIKLFIKDKFPEKALLIEQEF